MSLILNGKYKKILIFVLISDLVYVLIKALSNIEWFSEYLFARVISRGVSIVLQDVNSIFPFSIIETMVVLVILGVLALIGFLIFKRDSIDNSPKIDGYLLKFFEFIMCFVMLYVLIGTALYNRKEVYAPLGLEKVAPDEQLIVESLECYLDMLATTEAEISRDEQGNAVSPYSFEQLNALLNDEYERLTDNYFSKNKVRLKKVRLSFFMTFTYITGVYVAFLGESSINTNVPSYTLPVTMAHEMAHGKGCVRESDANCIAYYICVTSDNAYLRYCGLMEVCSSLFSKLSNEKRAEMITKFPSACLTEYQNANDFYDSYESVVEKVSDFINDVHLKGSGVKEGTISYVMTDGFLCSMYKGLYSEEID